MATLATAARLTAASMQDAPRTICFGVLPHKQGQEFYQHMAREMRIAVSRLPALNSKRDPEFSAGRACCATWPAAAM